MNAGLKNPVVFAQMYQHSKEEKSDFQLEAAADMGALMIDGLTDGIRLMNNGDIPARTIDETAFGILQAARLRTSKTEYISCPGCGRTLYDLRETIAKIKEATKHLEGSEDWHHGLHREWSWQKWQMPTMAMWAPVQTR